MDCSYWTTSPSCLWRNRGREHQNNKDGGGGGRQGYFEVKSRMRDRIGITEMKSRSLKPGVWSCPLLRINSNSYMYLVCGHGIEPALQRMNLGKITGSKDNSSKALLLTTSSVPLTLCITPAKQSNICLVVSMWAVSLIARALLSSLKGKRKLECSACFIRLYKSWVHSL